MKLDTRRSFEEELQEIAQEPWHVESTLDDFDHDVELYATAREAKRLTLQGYSWEDAIYMASRHHRHLLQVAENRAAKRQRAAR